jgi:transmembrane sensor
MSKHRFLELLEKQIRGQTSEDEDRLIEAIFEQMQERKVNWDFGVTEKELKERIKSKIDRELKPQKTLNAFTATYFKAAAMFLGLLIVSTIILRFAATDPQPPMEFRATNDTQKATITLSDGSKVYLNVNSKLEFPSLFGSDERRVSLEGEGFFEVSEDGHRPFIVDVMGVEARVLGTAFNVNTHRVPKVEVAVVSGSVGVRESQTEGDQHLVLSPSQMAVVDRESKNVSVEAIDIHRYMAWRAEKISFDLEPFDEVVSRLGDMYNINMELMGYGQGEPCLIRATYFNRSLFTVLYSLKNLVDFTYEAGEDRTMKIYYKGCEK